MLGVVKLVPVPKEAPPVEAAYQLMVPAAVVACRVAVPVPQIDAPVVEVNVGAHHRKVIALGSIHHDGFVPALVQVTKDPVP